MVNRRINNFFISNELNFQVTKEKQKFLSLKHNLMFMMRVRVWQVMDWIGLEPNYSWNNTLNVTR